MEEKELIYSKRPISIGKGLVVWIPKEIVDELKITKNKLLEIRIKVKR